MRSEPGKGTAPRPTPREVPNLLSALPVGKPSALFLFCLEIELFPPSLATLCCLSACSQCWRNMLIGSRDCLSYRFPPHGCHWVPQVPRGPGWWRRVPAREQYCFPWGFQSPWCSSYAASLLSTAVCQHHLHQVRLLPAQNSWVHATQDSLFRSFVSQVLESCAAQKRDDLFFPQAQRSMSWQFVRGVRDVCLLLPCLLSPPKLQWSAPEPSQASSHHFQDLELGVWPYQLPPITPLGSHLPTITPHSLTGSLGTHLPM